MKPISIPIDSRTVPTYTYIYIYSAILSNIGKRNKMFKGRTNSIHIYREARKMERNAEKKKKIGYNIYVYITSNSI